MLVGSCARCGAPATLRCAMCARTVCRNCLDEDERFCPDCVEIRKKTKGSAGPPLPPSRRIGRV